MDTEQATGSVMQGRSFIKAQMVETEDCGAGVSEWKIFSQQAESEHSRYNG
jgi:hypothetical protein